MESQVQEVTDALKETFDIDHQNSMDRSQVLGSDRIGYRSTHFVCTLGTARGSLIEYRELTELKFEVQVRTVLQHAWAELAHDRSFKFNPGLPQPIQRKLNLYAGMLEVVDAGFDAIAKEIDAYVKDVDIKNINEISKIDVDRVSLEKFIGIFVAENNLTVERMEIPTSVIKELKRFGISKIDDLRSIISQEFIRDFKQSEIEGRRNTYVGLLRDIMMYNDIDKYFKSPVEWGATTMKDIGLLSKKYGEKKVIAVLDKHDIFYDEEDKEEEYDEK